MDTPFASEVKSKDQIVLIVDKDNLFGASLAKQIKPHATVVLVSEKKPVDPSVVHIPFTKRVPTIPEGVYSHIFLISADQPEHELLMPLMEKANKDNAKFVYSIPYTLYTREVIALVSRTCIKWVVVLMGDIFGGEKKTSYIDHLLLEGKRKGSIHLPELGLVTLRPVAYKDAEECVGRVGFGFETGSVCFAFSKHSFTALSLIHGLQKVDPLLKIDFLTGGEMMSNPLLPEGVSLLPINYQVIKIMQELYQSLDDHMSSKQNSLQFPSKQVGKKHQSWKLPIISLITGMLFFLLLPSMWTFSTALLGRALLTSAKNEASAGDLQQAQTYAKSSETLFQASQEGSTFVRLELGVVGQQDKVDSLTRQLKAAKDLSHIVVVGLDAAISLQQVATGKTLTPEVTFFNGANSLKNAIQLLQQLDQKSLPSQVSSEIQKIQPFINVLGQTVDILPDLAGMNSPKTYVILFQNNTELRPGGGFIGSYATVTVKKGRMGKVAVHDVYDADGQLKGHVEPPFVIRRYIPLVHWYLRDSNFSADNTKNAQTAAFFLKQEAGLKTDGVIAIDLNFVKGMIKAVGSVYVPEYSQTVTADTFFLITESHAEKNSFAGSSQKKDFLNALFSALQSKLSTKKISYIDLMHELLTASKEKHLLFAFAEPSIQQVFTVNNLSSSLWDPRQALQNTLNDFVAVNDANIGVNKDNAFISRNIEQDMTIHDSGTVSGQLIIHYANTSDGTWPGGAYKNYLRILLPSGVTLGNISLNNVPQSQFPAVIDPKIYEAANFLPPKGIEIEHTQEGGREVYGFLVNVPIKSNLSVGISYTLAQKLDLTQQLATYDLLTFKQPGTDKDPYVLTLNSPSSFRLTKGPVGMAVSDGKTMVNTNLSSDLDSTFIFARK